MPGKRYTKEEINYISDAWGEVTFLDMSKKLGRSVASIQRKAREIGLNDMIHDLDFMLLSDMLRELGYPYHGHTYSRLKKIGFPISTKTVTGNKRYRVVKIDKFWKWLENNKTKMSIAKLEKNVLGKEPIWADEKRQKDKMLTNKGYIGFKEWSSEDDSLLISYVKIQNITYNEIADRLNRTPKAIMKRLGILGVCYRAVEQTGSHKKKKWTDEEINKMLEMKKSGASIYDIANAVGRTIQATEKKMNIVRKGVKDVHA